MSPIEEIKQKLKEEREKVITQGKKHLLNILNQVNATIETVKDISISIYKEITVGNYTVTINKTLEAPLERVKHMFKEILPIEVHGKTQRVH